MRLVLVFAAAIAALMAAGCHHTDYVYVVRVRHAAEVGCGLDDVGATELSSHTYMAWGCRTRAVYLCRHGGACTLDGEVTHE